ncbi:MULTISPECIES: peptide deformylase [Sphingobacterium]|uniref:peptide deformylase n=2 Tax=Sphingobacteriaceae TaxID=84566 RepID=UPI001969EA5E|nr:MULTISPECIES: peptide deformylase [unclassified Sphingobacterium]
MKLKNSYTVISYFLLAASTPTLAQVKVMSTMEKSTMKHTKNEGFNKHEKEIILFGDQHSKLHVYQTTDESEFKVLKNLSLDIYYADPLLPILKARMLLTVQDPTHPGVGIAAPQIGINRNIIWVQRFDKNDEPFEFYINPKITWKSQLIRLGTEGCLSIPDRKESIHRSYAIRIQYQDKEGQVIEENIEGFTAVIFQHEIDHLNGILYPDRLEEQSSVGYVELNEKIPFSLQIQGKTILP